MDAAPKARLENHDRNTAMIADPIRSTGFGIMLVSPKARGRGIAEMYLNEAMLKKTVGDKSLWTWSRHHPKARIPAENFEENPCRVHNCRPAPVQTAGVYGGRNNNGPERDRTKHKIYWK